VLVVLWVLVKLVTVCVVVEYRVEVWVVVNVALAV
jgi:hypothetical protein